MKARAAFLRGHPLCVVCSTDAHPVVATEVDHKVPLHKGGSDDDSNKQALCGACHAMKTAQDMGYALRGCDASGTPATGWSA